MVMIFLNIRNYPGTSRRGSATRTLYKTWCVV